jgi:tetratricopeptide (TPR) repeat protein
VAEEITVQINGSVQGSGVLIKKVNDLYTVLTAWHVIKENSANEEVIIKTYDGKTHIWQGDSLTQIGSIDLATFTFKSQENYKLAKLGSSKNVLEGNEVFIAGYPRSKTLNSKRDYRFKSGEVEEHRSYLLRNGYQIFYSNSTVRGMSGGSILNKNGELIGIHGQAEKDQYLTNQLGKLVMSGTNRGIPISFYKSFLNGTKNLNYSSDAITKNDFLERADDLLGNKGSEYEVIWLANKVLILEDNPKAYYFKAYAKRDLEEYKDAIYYVNKSIELDPKYINAYHLRGAIKYYLEDNSGSLEDFKYVLKNDKERKLFDTTYHNIGILKSDNNEEQEAIYNFNKAIEINSEYLNAYNNRGVSFMALGKYEEAIKDFDKVLEIDPEYSIGYFNRGLSLSNLEKYEEAIKDFDIAMKLGPENPEYLNGRGTSLDLLGKHEEAIKDFDIAIKLDPEEPYYFFNRGTSLNTLEKYKEAIKAFDVAIKLDPEDPDYFIYRGYALNNLQKYEEAIKDFDIANKLDPKNPYQFFYRGNSFHQLERYKEALEDYNKAIKLDPKDPVFFYNRGVSFHALEKYEDALKDYDKAIELDPKDSYLYFSRGMSYEYLKLNEEALKNFQIAVKLDPDNFFALSIIEHLKNENN